MASALRQLETIAWRGDTTHNLIFPSQRLHNKHECLLCLVESAEQKVLGEAWGSGLELGSILSPASSPASLPLLPLILSKTREFCFFNPERRRVIGLLVNPFQSQRIDRQTESTSLKQSCLFSPPVFR